MEVLCPLGTIALAIGLLLVGGWGYTIGRIKEDRCAVCKYPTAGLIGETCPECGGDLRGAGTCRAREREIVRPTLAVMVICRTLLVRIPLLVMYGFCVYQFPRVVSWDMHGPRAVPVCSRRFELTDTGALTSHKKRLSGMSDVHGRG